MIVGAIDFGTSNSGWAFSFLHEFQADPTKVSVRHWPSGGKLVTEKAPTIALISPGGKELVAFGYDAENRYTTLLENGEHEGYYYFKEFKMALNKKLNQGLNRHITIEDCRRKSLPAMRVFSLTIAYLVKDMVSQGSGRIAGGIKHDDVHWVLTVPAIWTDSAKQFMTEAAIEAGISENKLSIVLEPEAASVYCRHIQLDASSTASGKAEFEVGTKYMVVDAGGGTIDITVHEVQGSGAVKEIHAAGGGGWGGTMVNQAFENMMRDIVGKAVYDKFVKTETEDWIDLYRDFEIKKKDIGRTESKMVTFKLPASLGKLLKKETKQDIEDQIRSCRYSDKITLKGDKMRLDQKVVEDLFSNSVSKTMNYIKTLLRHQKVRDISAVLMVGGFSDSPMLQNAVKSEFKHLKVVVPRDAASVVLKGAVILGHKPNTISGRILQYTYGYKARLPFKEGVHPEENKIIDDCGVRCKAAFNVYTRRGDTVTFGQTPVEERLSPSYSTQTSCSIPIYATQSATPPVVIDESLIEIGELIVNFEDHDGDINRKIIFTMDFSATTIQATAYDKKTGKSVNASLNFLG